MSTPQSIINICSGVRLDNRYQHSIYFANATAQREYFAGKVVKTFPAYSYLRKSWPIQVQATMEQAKTWSYLYFQNSSTGKYYYYFINNIEYKNDNTVELSLEMDVLQTYLFDFKDNLLDCFVVRQHVDNDQVGLHTVPESLEQGQYQNYHIFNMEDCAEMGVLVLSSLYLAPPKGSELYSIVPSDFTEPSYARSFDGVYSGLGVYAFNDMTYLAKVLEVLDEKGKADAITAIWMYPKSLISMKYPAELDDGTPYTWSGYDWNTCYVGIVDEAIGKYTSLAMYDNYEGSMFGGYVPKNNKLYTFPYNLLYVTDNQGGTAEYRFEWFDTPEDVYQFQIFSAISPVAGIKLAPMCYNVPGSNINYDEGITLANYPPCAWDSDSYKVWLAQNYNQLKHAENTATLAGLAGLGTMVAGMVTYNPALIAGGAGAMFGSFNQIQSIMAQKEDAKAQPPQSKGTFSSTVNVANGRQTFSIYYKSIRAEYARQIDEYFTMYGYQINRVQKPNINARKAFTYVKTIGCQIKANLCTEDMVKIERIFDNGVTWWKSGDKIADYTQTNTTL